MNENLNNQQVNKQNKSSMGIAIVIIILLIAIIGLLSYKLFFDNDKNNNTSPTENNSEIKQVEPKQTEQKSNTNSPASNTETNTENQSREPKIDYSIVKKENKNCLTFNEQVDENLCFDSIQVLGQVGDALLVEETLLGDMGIILVKVSGTQIGFNSNFPKFSYWYRGGAKIENNSIIVTHDILGQDPKHIACQKSSTDEVEYIEKYTYANGAVSEPEIVNRITAEQYIKNNNISCSE